MDNTCVRVALVGEMVVAPVAWFRCQLLGLFGGRGVAQRALTCRLAHSLDVPH